MEVYRTDSVVRVQARALGAICNFESQRERAHELMREAFSSTESALREEAMWSLVMMEQFDEAFDLEFALKGLDDESQDVRLNAVWLLNGRISPESLGPHQEFLRGLADSDDENVREAVKQQLLLIQEATED